MNRVSKLTFVTTACLAVTGATAFADDPPAGGGAGVDVSGGAAVGGDPAGTPPPPGATPAGPVAGGAGSKIIGIDGVAVLPLSDYADLATAGIGVLGRFEYGVNDMLSVTGRVGFIYNLIKSDFEGFGLNFIPIYAGIKYKIGTSGLFAFGEAGITYTLVTIDIGGESASDSETDLGATGGVGYQTGKLNFRGTIFAPDIGEVDSALGIMATVGFDITAL